MSPEQIAEMQRRASLVSLPVVTLVLRLRSLNRIALRMPAGILWETRAAFAASVGGPPPAPLSIHPNAMVWLAGQSLYSGVMQQLRPLMCPVIRGVEPGRPSGSHGDLCPEPGRPNCPFCTMAHPMGSPAGISIGVLPFEAPHIVESGETFQCRVDLFGPMISQIGRVVEAFDRAGERGLGPGWDSTRGCFDVVECLSAYGLEWEDAPEAVRVDFLTPLTTKVEGGLSLPWLWQVIRKRLHGRNGMDGVWGMRAMGVASATAEEVEAVDWERAPTNWREEAWSLKHDVMAPRPDPWPVLSEPESREIVMPDSLILRGALGPLWPELRMAREVGLGGSGGKGLGRISLTPLD